MHYSELDLEIKSLESFLYIEQGTIISCEGFIDFIKSIIKRIIDVIKSFLQRIRSIWNRFIQKLKSLFSSKKEDELSDDLIAEYVDNLPVDESSKLDKITEKIKYEIIKTPCVLISEQEEINILHFAQHYADSLQAIYQDTYASFREQIKQQNNPDNIDIINILTDVCNKQNINNVTPRTLVYHLVQTYEEKTGNNLPEWLIDQLCLANKKIIEVPHTTVESIIKFKEYSTVLNYDDTDFEKQNVIKTYRKTALNLNASINNSASSYTPMIGKLCSSFENIYKEAYSKKTISDQHENLSNIIVLLAQIIHKLVTVVNYNEFEKINIGNKILNIFEKYIGNLSTLKTQITQRLTRISDREIRPFTLMAPKLHIRELPVYLLEDLYKIDPSNKWCSDEDAFTDFNATCMYHRTANLYFILVNNFTLNNEYGSFVLGHEYGHYYYKHNLFNFRINQDNDYHDQRSKTLKFIINRPLVDELQADVYSAKEIVHDIVFSYRALLHLKKHIGIKDIATGTNKSNLGKKLGSTPLNIVSDVNSRVAYFEKWVDTGIQPPLKRGVFEY